MVLLVTVLLSVSALSAADSNTSSTISNNTMLSNMDDATSTKSVTNIESNSIENKVSNEYETITNEHSSLNQKSITKQTINTDTTKTASTKQKIIITSKSITTYASQTININATVTYKNGENLNSAKASIKINNNTIGQTKVTNGKISYKYTVPKWSAKVYNLTIIVGETSTSLKGSKDVKLTIKKHNLRIYLSSFNISSAGKRTLNANVKYENGTLADGQNAVFKVNGITIGSTKVKKGVASLSYIVPAKAGTYTLVLKVGESTISNSKEYTTKFKVNKRTPSVSLDKLFFVKSGNSVTFKAKYYNVGYTNATGKVSFKIDGKTVGTVNLVNSTATYKYKDTGLKKGLHVVSVVYSGSNALNARSVNTSLRVQNDLVSTYTYSQILKKANETYNYILKNKRLPNYANINGNQLSMPDFLYLMVQAVSHNNSFHNGGFSASSATIKTSKYDAQISKSEYIDLAQRLVRCYIINGRPIHGAKTSSGVTLSYNDTVYTYVKICSFMYKNNRLPNYSTVTKINPTISEYVTTNKVPAGYEKYVTQADNAYVNSTAIKNTLKTLTSGVSGLYNQAVTIYNYVRDKISYSSYSNTHYGALKTLEYKKGNCVDQSHLLLSMYRTANIPARYCHATCTFRSGLVVGHVWVEAYVNGKWYKCDTTSRQNSFNNIVNWYKSTTVYRYTELYF